MICKSKRTTKTMVNRATKVENRAKTRMILGIMECAFVVMKDAVSRAIDAVKTRAFCILNKAG